LGGFLDNEGNWRWVTGEDFNFTFWAEYEPSGGDENSLVLWNGEWNDLAQDNLWEQTGFICEWEREPMLPSNPNFGIISKTGFCIGAACHGTIPTSLARGMKMSSGIKSGMRFGIESIEGINDKLMAVS
jgi:hypothetical protein